ncbi:MAG: PadR family transcriptional regulator [Erysipelotrichaceae bacterium]|nr:PadR family transcriptional regulator [Erysipelotrichaceae bacterium]MBQ7890422.1 PadR family transcriptional regulator [Erysipelotrichaceae bacterium]
MNSQFKKGVLELVVMIVVSQHDIYGYELVKQVCEVVQVNEGTIYPLLKRMTNEKYFETYLRESTEGPPRKYYRITPLGLEAMNQLKYDWLQFSRQINQFIEGDCDHD